MNLTFPTYRKLKSGPTSLRYMWPWRTLPSQRRNLLRLIAVATEQHFPLAPLLEAWAHDERGVQISRVHRLADLLKKGTPLPDAVEEVPDALRDADVLALRFGVQSGTLAASLQEAQADGATQRPAPLLRWTIAYFAIVMLLFVIIVTFIYVTIMPSMMSILDDFEMSPPPVMRWSLAFASFVEKFWFVFFLVTLLAAWSMVSAKPGRFLRRSALGRFFGPVRTLQFADVLENLSVAASAGRPMTGAISTLARYHFDPSTRRKLLFVRNEIEQGADVWESMAGAGLLTAPEERLLAAADRVGNRPWTLRTLAATKKRRTWRKLGRIAAMLLPTMVVLLGAFVLFQALSMFMPLIQIVTSLT